MKIKDFYLVKLLLYLYKRFFERNPLILLLLFALLLNVVSWILVSFRGRPENYIIPLHYIPVKGVDKTGPWFMIYEIPLAGFVILIVNFLIAFNLLKKDLKASYLIASATILLGIFFVIASWSIAFKV